jgi:hypothetical protein
MTPYGYISKRYRFVFGPGNFEMPRDDTEEADKLLPLFPCYLEPQYPGQEPWGGVVPRIGMLYHYPEHIGYYSIEPLYLGVEL